MWVKISPQIILRFGVYINYLGGGNLTPRPVKCGKEAH